MATKFGDIFGGGSGIVSGHDNIFVVGFVNELKVIPIGFIPNDITKLRVQVYSLVDSNYLGFTGSTPSFTPLHHIPFWSNIPPYNISTRVSFLLSVDNLNLEMFGVSHTDISNDIVTISFRVWEIK